ncbi:protein disulfide-isomerase [Colletotrichum spaethianum]|uniref:Protein disulfide-isomerase n=1 Tax=Colletotrichum spaethianum TaxID=700344 RepID=A0AA37PDW6_9PEZI|nr:protein disulfide-isomerase [Colletotrichum spaethianum]GKT50456.1 protein disulfide-isomerase [Colletotrichum spaethianum]
MTHANKRYFTESRENVLYYFDVQSDNRDRYSSNVRELAKKHINELEFVTVDPVSFPEVPTNLVLKWNFPAIVLQDKKRGFVFSSERKENIKPELVDNFLQSVTDGSVRPAFQDPAEPAVKDEGINVDTGTEEKVAHDEL